MDLHTLTIPQLQKGLRDKGFKAVEVTDAYLKNIEVRDGEIGAYLHVDRENAVVEAEKIDLAIAKGESLPPLAGVPMGIKDAILVRGMKATAGSKILEQYEAAYDATAVARLKAAGAVVLGKTNLDEFAMGSSTENSAYGPTKNPHDLTRVPGGSSGGSAAAVAGDMALAALGSDTGGSVRQPAHFCGVVGLKPTYGAVSRHGLVALASSLDQIGPFAKTVEDAAIVFRAIAGADPYDSTSAGAHYGDELLQTDFKKIKGMKIGLPEEYFVEGLEPEVRAGVLQAIEVFKNAGAEIRNISLPHTKYALSVYYIVLTAEVSSNLARYDGVRYPAKSLHDRGASGQSAQKLLQLYKKTRSHGFGPETKRRIILGTFVLSSGYYDAYYAKAQKVRTLIKRDFTDAFNPPTGGVDLILTPVAPTRAFKLGEKTHDPLQMYLSDALTIPANLAGIPGISIPVYRPNLKRIQTNANESFDRDSKTFDNNSGELPTGFQLLARPFREADLFNAGRYYELTTNPQL